MNLFLDKNKPIILSKLFHVTHLLDTVELIYFHKTYSFIRKDFPKYCLVYYRILIVMTQRNFNKIIMLSFVNQYQWEFQRQYQ